MIFELGVFELILRKKQSLVFPALSLLVQTLLYQGLILNLCDFFYYSVLPLKGMRSEEFGHYSKMDTWDMLIIIDISIFFCTMATLFICIFANLVDNNSPIFKVMREHDKESQSKDFLETSLEIKKNLIALNSMAIVSIVFLF